MQIVILLSLTAIWVLLLTTYLKQAKNKRESNLAAQNNNSDNSDNPSYINLFPAMLVILLIIIIAETARTLQI